jgi:hypothetical protein
MKFLFIPIVLFSISAGAQVPFYQMPTQQYRPPVQYNVPMNAPRVYQAPIYVPQAPMAPTGGSRQAYCVQTQFGLSCR